MQNRLTFDNELRTVQDEILKMGSEVVDNIVRATEALRTRDLDTAHEIIRVDKSINSKRIELVLKGLSLIATQQPFARDMRLLAAVLEIVGELERIHDYAKGIARITIALGTEHKLNTLMVDLPEMARVAADMLHQAMNAFAEADGAAARSIPQLDDKVDELFNREYAEILAFMAAQPSEFDAVNRVGWALHNLERAADRVINICEWVNYMKTGQYVEFNQAYYGSASEDPGPA